MQSLVIGGANPRHLMGQGCGRGGGGREGRKAR